MTAAPTIPVRLARLLAGAAWLCAAPVFGAIDQPLLVVTGDFDGDGQTDRVQGYPGASEGAGRVDVFWGDPLFRPAWPTVLSAVKDPATRLAAGRLGESLAVGDFNGDRLDDLAIGAPQTDLATEPTDPTVPLRPQVFTHAGSVVVLYGCRASRCTAVDVRGAGRPAVGSPLDPSSTAGAQQIVASARASLARFGKSLAAGDFNGDGFDDLAIGAPGDTVGGDAGAGSVTVISGSADGLALATRRVIHQDLLPAGASPSEVDDHFGSALASARLDADADDDLVVGVPDEDYGEDTNAGEVDVFWGTSAGLSTTTYVRFRHLLAMTGGDRSSDRLGHELRAHDGVAPRLGSLDVSLAQATSCGGKGAFLALPAGTLGSASPAAVLECDADICDAGSTPGDGALPAIPVNFIVIANGTTTRATDLPTETWTGRDPITGGAISGVSYFKAMTDLLNQQVRADDGNPVCDEQDCLRFTYRSHRYYSSGMFSSNKVKLCPKLEAIARPSQNDLGEDLLAFTSNCGDFDSCPQQPRLVGQPEQRYATFSDFAEAAVDECTLLTDEEALNVIVYDVCERQPGPDNVENTDDDVQSCTGSQDGRGRVNGNRPYFFVDHARALRPRAFGTSGFPWAAEEHEVGHAFGLLHACEPAGHGGNTRTMQTGACPSGLGWRNLGFATQARLDLDNDPVTVFEVETMIRTAREHVKVWQCP